MAYNLEFQIAGIIVTLILILVYFSKPRWKSIQNMFFRYLMLATFIELAFDIISVITITERNVLPSTLNDFFSKGYLIIMFVWITLCVIYNISNTLYEDMSKLKRKFKKVSCIAMCVLLVACTVYVFLNPLYYAGEGRRIYSYGPASMCTYIFSIVGVIISVVWFIIDFKHISLKRKISVLSFTIMEGLVAMFQLKFPELLVIGFGTSVCILLMYMTLENPDMDLIARLDDANKRSNELLLNILPSSIAGMLQKTTETITEEYSDVTVAFMDIVNFTRLSAEIGAEKLVGILNSLFSEIDTLLDDYRIEKIKTIGDAYMVASGVPDRYAENCKEMLLFLIAVQKLVSDFNKKNNLHLTIRYGMNSGPVIAGVIGKKKFIYDLWGATVNFASRMESYGKPDRIHVSESVYGKLKDEYKFEKQPDEEIKGCGLCKTYFFDGVVDQQA